MLALNPTFFIVNFLVVWQASLVCTLELTLVTIVHLPIVLRCMVGPQVGGIASSVVTQVAQYSLLRHLFPMFLRFVQGNGVFSVSREIAFTALFCLAKVLYVLVHPQGNPGLGGIIAQIAFPCFNFCWVAMLVHVVEKNLLLGDFVITLVAIVKLGCPVSFISVRS